MVGGLFGDDAQAFVDTLYEASTYSVPHLKKSIDLGLNVHTFNQLLDELPTRIYRMSMRSLREICGRQALLPSALKLVPHFSAPEGTVYHSKFGDVWKGQHKGELGATFQVSKIPPGNNTENIRGVSFLRSGRLVR